MMFNLYVGFVIVQKAINIKYTFKEIINTKKNSGDKASRFFYQPLSNIFLYLCLRTNVSAIVAGWIMALSSILAGIFFLTGIKVYLIIGSILFIFAMIFDHLDGDLARITKKFSKVGIFLDNVHHTCEELFVFIGLGIYISLQTENIIYILLGVITSALIFILSDFKAITFWFCKRDVYYDNKYRKFPHVLYFGEFFKEWHFIILFALIFGYGLQLLIIAFIWSLLRFLPHLYTYYYECKLYDKENK